MISFLFETFQDGQTTTKLYLLETGSLLFSSAPVVGVGNVSGVRTELLVTRFTDKLLLTITQLNKFGTWLQLDRAVVRPDRQDTGSVTRHVYTCTVLLGQDTEEVQFLGRTLIEKLDTDKTVILTVTVGVKNLTVPSALKLANCWQLLPRQDLNSS